ncbi:MAG: hypothetical protein Ct9H300mP5_2030 [Candidatus Pelagibacterales bacterium]|nr:MAG: hypothetical protein Ct9H300mP5_2030 [Pelagibacterales bacterium]
MIALDNAEIKYSTVQNWYPGDKDGKVEYIILLQREDYAKEKILKFLGHKLKQDRNNMEVSKLYFTR